MATQHLVFIDRERWDRKMISRNFSHYKITFLSDLGHWEQIKDATVLSIFINTKINKAVLDKLPKLKFIATRSTGFDHIDISSCKLKGIKVANVPTYGENTVAEHTFGLILNLSRKIYQAVNRTKSGNFSIKDLMGFDLKGKTIGVIGAGNIGRHVIRIALGFEMKILVSDPSLSKEQIKKIGAVKTDLNTLLKKSDIVSLHCPLCKPTIELINAGNIKLMKKGALLINTARGELMDTTAVLEALHNGQLGGVGLDALEAENALHNEDKILDAKFDFGEIQKVLENHVLIKQQNAIVTPHIAFNSHEAVNRILETTIQNIKGFLIGKNKNIVS